eukprot:TRINITY_DN39686_c0_g1_i1.p1 TRINITY_DN39686_c0_g1~~TRINITY_DN39686_c0_g1_i1.p1  ORF type:complete len:175 (-),score=49.81 TRINITY_DN39686_c0_g1_i1:85-549(-)
MLRSLVGSEMCIRDRLYGHLPVFVYPVDGKNEDTLLARYDDPPGQMLAAERRLPLVTWNREVSGWCDGQHGRLGLTALNHCLLGARGRARIAQQFDSLDLSAPDYKRVLVVAPDDADHVQKANLMGAAMLVNETLFATFTAQMSTHRELSLIHI